MTQYWIILAAAIVLSMLGQTLLKIGAGAGTFLNQLLDLRSLSGLSLYGGAALLYMIALRRIPVSVALPCTAISYVMVAAIGHFGFGEPIGRQHVFALGLISLGVVMLATA